MTSSILISLFGLILSISLCILEYCNWNDPKSLIRNSWLNAIQRNLMFSKSQCLATMKLSVSKYSRELSTTFYLFTSSYNKCELILCYLFFKFFFFFTKKMCSTPFPSYSTHHIFFRLISFYFDRAVRAF